MTRHGLRHLLPLLSGSLTLLLAGTALAAPGERPRLGDYPTYGQFVTAVVDYERAQDAAARNGGGRSEDTSRLCKDSNGTDSTNNCQGRDLIAETPLPGNARRQPDAADDLLLRGTAGAAESLEEAVASAGYDGTAAANADALRQDRRSMGLQEISLDEMANAGISGLLGLVNNARMQNLQRTAAPLGAWGLAAGGQATGTAGASDDPDGSVRVALDDFVLALDDLNIELLSSLVDFGEGYAIIDSRTSINAKGGLHLELSSEVYTSLTAVDRDGLPGSAWAGAGALTVDRMAIFMPRLEVDIQGVSAGFERDNSLLTVNAYSPGEITVDMANSLVGVAPASVDGRTIGPSTPFLKFGPDGGVTVGAGTRVNVVLSRPDGLRTPLVTLNGRVGDISVRDLRILDTVGGGDIRIGRFAIHNLNLVDTRVFIEDQVVTVDVGRGIDSVDLDIERVYLGSDSAGAFVGDFYTRGGRLNELRFTARPH